MMNENKPLLHLFLHIGKLLNGRLNGALREHAIHSGQARILGVLYKHGPLPQVVIGRDLQVKSATVTNMVKRMEKGGLISRRRDMSDNRIVIVSLTENGKKAALFSIEVINQIEKEIREAVNRETVQTIRKPLENLIEASGGIRPSLH